MRRPWGIASWEMNFARGGFRVAREKLILNMDSDLSHSTRPRYQEDCSLKFWAASSSDFDHWRTQRGRGNVRQGEATQEEFGKQRKSENKPNYA